tara:strand:+ start:3014 stop:4798 length:1785 start_codon:yes stop_codon:yes gene_type:complete
MESKMIRQPIVSVLGHVDHGKTTLLDNLRGTSIAEKESGGITQHIGATELPINSISKLCGGLLSQLNVDITIPGLLFIDTPGHEAFSQLRNRGGALGDLAILVIDLNEGFQPQTEEALDILKRCQTPFLVAANKIDRIPKWQIYQGFPFAHSFLKQTKEVQRLLDEKTYELIGLFYKKGFEAERFDRIEKFEKQIAIIPISAKTGEGLPELLMLLIGLTQKFLKGKLEISVKRPGKGIILEVKEEVGHGTTLDVIIYDGNVKTGDQIVVGGRNNPIFTKVRSILKPMPMDEIRDPKSKFNSVKNIHASSGVKISGKSLGDAVAGSSIHVVENIKESTEEIEKDLADIKIETKTVGVIIKTDTLGSLEALVKMLGQEEIPIRLAQVGDISRRDVIEAETVLNESKYRAVILGFNVKILKDAVKRSKSTGVCIFTSNVIYKLVKDYQLWVLEQKEKELKYEFKNLTKPAKIEVLPGCTFRVSQPAIIGIEVLKGIIKTKVKLINSIGKSIGTVKGLQERNESISQANMGKQVAMAVEGPTVGRQINEGDILYTDMLESEIIHLESRYKENLGQDEMEVLEELLKIKRKENPTFGRR